MRDGLVLVTERELFEVGFGGRVEVGDVLGRSVDAEYESRIGA